MTPPRSSRHREPRVPCPGVAFGPDFVRRLERLTLRISAARERREGQGRAALAGGGEEFLGYRPYRAGEDLRRLDWDLMARLDRPYVRVTRREAAERWAVLVDGSASMGVGPPGKLQAAAELAAALACVALRQGAQLEVRVSGPPPARMFRMRRKGDLPGLLGFLQEQRAAGVAGIAALLAEQRLPGDCGRVFVIGDLLDLEPAAVLRLAAPGRALFAAQLLAPLELAPPAGAAVEWLDPEGGERLALDVDASTLAEYEGRLEARLEEWASIAARHGVRYGLWRSDRPFEEIAQELLQA
jgi:uncharacterized protein (DUF58 family)